MIITAELANLYYNDSGIKERILGEDRNTKQIFAEEILKTILEQSQVDAVAAYKHEAVARGLPYITLPTEINLSDLEFTDFYRKAFYTFDDSSGSGQTVFGEPIYFAVTIPETVKNLEGATSFVDFMLSTKGKDLLEKQGLKYIKPAIIQGNAEKMPLSLQNLTEHLP
jgi:molybdate/tungstate transport system substrate-binding protein